MRFLFNVAKNIFKHGGIGQAAENTIKKFLYIVLAFFAFIIIVILIIQSLMNSFLCKDLIQAFIDEEKIGLECPKPPVDLDKLKELANDLERERNSIWGDLENKGSNERFRTIDEAKTMQGEKKDREIFSEAEFYVRVMSEIDFSTYIMYIRSGDLKKGKPLDNSTIDYSVMYAQEDFKNDWTNWFRSEESKNKKFNKNRSHYLMNYRLKVYRCFLLGEDCTDKIIQAMGTDKYQGVAVKLTSGKHPDFAYPRLMQILETFYQISFVKYLDGKVEKIPKGTAYYIFSDMLNERLQYYNEIYPPQVPEGSAFSMGWLNPMIVGTYNFASPFGMRNGKPHQGVDMGTLGVDAVPIFATKGGTVIGAGWNDGGYGGVVTIDHGDGYYSTYNHMKLENIVVRKGQTVSQGQLIGATGGEPNLPIHLHFEICTSIQYGSGYDLSGGKLPICNERVNPEKSEFQLNLRNPQDMNKTKQYAAKFKNEWRSKALKGEVILMPGFSPLSSLGQLSSKYESSGDPGLCVHNQGDAGGLSCGTYQIATNVGTMDEFLKFLKQHHPQYYQKLANVPKTLSEFGAAWRAVYNSDKQGFAQAQHDFIGLTHYVPIVEAIKSKYGFDANTRHRAVMEMFWSFSVQHRYNTLDAWEATIGHNWKKMSDAQIITKMYDYRINRWSCCTKRFVSEKKEALAMLGSSK